jgi:hypothetical protein
MNKFFAAIALATIVASPALAQSFDSSVGSGNVAQQTVSDGARGALAQLRNDLSGRTNEVTDHAKGNIW